MQVGFELMELSDAIRLCNPRLNGAETHLRIVCNVEKFSVRFINLRFPLKRETEMAEGGKELKEGMEEEGRNDRRGRLNV
jgi:hypothetical protein